MRLSGFTFGVAPNFKLIFRRSGCSDILNGTGTTSDTTRDWFVIFFFFFVDFKWRKKSIAKT